MKKGRAGFVVMKGGKAKIILFDCSSKLSDVDYFVNQFDDEKDFLKFLGEKVLLTDVGNSDVFIFSNGEKDYRYSELIFGAGKDFSRQIDLVRSGKAYNFQNELDNAVKSYKESDIYKKLYNSVFNTTYDKFRKMFGNAVRREDEEFPSRTWLADDGGAYNNYRDLVFLRVLSSKLSGANNNTITSLCIKQGKIIQFRNKNKFDISTRIDNFDLKNMQESSWLDPDLIVISPFDYSYLYNQEKGINDPSIDGFIQSKSGKKSFDSSVIKKLSKYTSKGKPEDEIDHDIVEILNIVDDETLFPYEAFRGMKHIKRTKQGEKKVVDYYLDYDALLPGYDDESKDLLKNKFTFNFIGKIYLRHYYYNKYQEHFAEGSDDTSFYYYNYLESGVALDKHLQKLVDPDVRNFNAFDKIYKFCKLLESTKAKDKDKSDEKGKGSIKK